ncbi:MAG: FAD-dependent monooxygenase [Alphaproteobacteria bacterium]
MTGLRIGICGGGVGGLAAAIALDKMGHDPAVFEQASRFTRIGSDVNLTPNAVHAVDRLGVGDVLRQTAARPTFRISRIWDTGEETSRLPMSSAAEEKYGAPQLTIHRADLLKALEDRVPAERLHLGKKVKGIVNDTDRTAIEFDDGTTEDVDVIVGADGIHSAVRNALFGKDDPKFTGIVSYRATFPRDRAGAIPNLDAFTKWWGPNPETQLVVFPLTRGEEIFVFATTPQDGWTEEGWTLPGDVDELRSMYEGFHPEARALLDACSEVTKSALHVREPMEKWSACRATLLGDAAHPMVPFMAQGACMAIEDAVVLARALDGADLESAPEALRRYENARMERTASIQRNSLANEWMKEQGNADWVYGYHAWEVALD